RKLRGGPPGNRAAPAPKPGSFSAPDQPFLDPIVQKRLRCLIAKGLGGLYHLLFLIPGLNRNGRELRSVHIGLHLVSLLFLSRSKSELGGAHSAIRSRQKWPTGFRPEPQCRWFL